MATPLVRRLSPTHDMTFGRGLADYAVGSESTAQRLRCFLLTILGEWFLDTDRGVPWWQPEGSAVRPIMGGGRNLQYTEAVIKAGILGIEGISSITSFSMRLDTATRRLRVNATGLDDDGDIWSIVQVGP